MAAKIKALLGDKVKKQSKEDVAVDSFCGAGKYVGLYFSAHWCPPCRAFTPKLTDFYKKLREKGKSNLEIVFVSCDRDEKSFTEYFNSMPWLAMDFSNEEKRTSVMDKFDVNGIPMLIILDGNTGEIFEENGREKVQDDPNGDNFPWK